MKASPAACLLLLLSALLLAAARADEYRYGRATNYIDNNQGSCHYKDVYNMRCGKCFEVVCVKKDFRDGYGQWLQRWFACKDENKRVVVKITDSCPCVHANAYSNKRWCCGDMPHLDLGIEAFKELADDQWGVISIKFKEVGCDKLGPQ